MTGKTASVAVAQVKAQYIAIEVQYSNDNRKLLT